MGILLEGLVVTVIGMGIVFSILIIISISVGFLKIIFLDKKPAQKEEAKVQTVAATDEQIPKPYNNEFEIVAAITAAIASTLNKSTDELVVRSYHRVTIRK